MTLKRVVGGMVYMTTAVVFCARAASAQDSLVMSHVAPIAQAPVRLRLEEALARGVKASHRLEEMRARREGAEASLAGRQADLRPELALEGGYTRTNHVDEFGVLTPVGTRN